MECLRRAAQPGISDITALRLHSKAVSLANLAMRTQRELQKCQAAPPAYPVPAEPEAADEPQQAPAPQQSPRQHTPRPSPRACLPTHRTYRSRPMVPCLRPPA
jgi:hypothetical protein